MHDGTHTIISVCTMSVILSKLENKIHLMPSFHYCRRFKWQLPLIDKKPGENPAEQIDENHWKKVPSHCSFHTLAFKRGHSLNALGSCLASRELSYSPPLRSSEPDRRAPHPSKVHCGFPYLSEDWRRKEGSSALKGLPKVGTHSLKVGGTVLFSPI